jgi:hypothetical protein
MPISQLDGGLQRVVVRGANALELVDVAVLRIEVVVRPFYLTLVFRGLGWVRILRRRDVVAGKRLVDVEQAEQVTTF